MKTYISLALLVASFLNCSASVEPQTKYGQWDEWVTVDKENPLKTVDVSLWQEVIHNPDTVLEESTYEKMANSEGSYNPKTKLAFIDQIYVFDNPTYRRGCGSRLFKQTIAELYKNFPCSKIVFLAFPFKDEHNPKALARLEKFYVNLGSEIVERCKDKNGIDMSYPLHLAAALAQLMPLLEPRLLDESLDNDPVTTIIQYIGIQNKYPEDAPAAGAALANTPLEKMDSASIELL